MSSSTQRSISLVGLVGLPDLNHYWPSATTRPSWSKMNIRPPTTHIRNTSFSSPTKKPGSSGSLGRASDVHTLLPTDLSALSCSLEAIREAEICSDAAGIVSHRVEKSPGLKAEKVECDDGA